MIFDVLAHDDSVVVVVILTNCAVERGASFTNIYGRVERLKGVVVIDVAVLAHVSVEAFASNQGV